MTVPLITVLFSPVFCIVFDALHWYEKGVDDGGSSVWWHCRFHYWYSSGGIGGGDYSAGSGSTWAFDGRDSST